MSDTESNKQHNLDEMIQLFEQWCEEDKQLTQEELDAQTALIESLKVNPVCIWSKKLEDLMKDY